MKRVTTALLLALLLSACDSGSGDGAKAPGATLRIDVIGQLDPKADPAALDGPRAVLTDATQEGLVDFDASGQVVPGLATSWRVSGDGLSYIFRLREARWEDDRSITSGDVVAVMRRVMGRRSTHPLKPLLMRIENAADIAAGRKSERTLGVHDPMPNIVEIRLSSPQPNLLQLLAHPSMAIMRKGSFPPSNGPFRVTDTKAFPLELNRNRRFYDAGSVPVEVVKLQPSPEAVEAVGRFRRGATDLVTGGTVAGIGEARTVPITGALQVEPSYGVYGYIANVTKGPLAHPRVRRALAMAVPREALIARIFAIPAMQPLTGMVPPTLPSYGSGAEPDWAHWLPEERVAEAQRLLAEAGYGPEKPLEITVAIPAAREHAAVLEAVTAAWAPLGVKVTAETRSVDAHAATVAKGDYQLALVERISPADSKNFFLLPFTCAVKTGGYCNKEVDRLLDLARTTGNIEERTQALRRAEKLMIDDTPAIMLFVPVRWSLVHPRVSGWSPNIIGAHPLSRLDVLPDAERSVVGR